MHLGHAVRFLRALSISWVAWVATANLASAGEPDPGCPGVNRVTCGLETHDVSTPTFNSNCKTAIGFGSAGYDYPAGTLTLTGYTIYPVGVHLVDAFTFHGPPPGAPVTFGLRVHYDVFVTSELSQGHLFLLPFNELPGDESPLITFPTSPTHHDVGTLVMTLTRPAEMPIGLEIDANLGMAGLDSGAGSFTFDFVLPSGVSVTSCNGFVQEAPVPAHSATWGSLKAAYR